MKIKMKKVISLVLVILILLSNSPISLAVGKDSFDEHTKESESIVTTNTRDIKENLIQQSHDTKLKEENIDLSIVNEKTNDKNVLKFNNFKTKSSVDFSEKITSIVISKQVGYSWVQSTQFNDGDSVKVDIKYALSPNDLGQGNAKIHYQIPKGIKVSEESSGNVESKGKTVGTYKIGTDGKIEITFNDDFIESDAGIDGTVSFKGTVSKDGVDQDGKIKFPGKNHEITIVKPPKPPEENKYDIKTEKTGKISDKKDKINYKIIISTLKGTGNVIKIEDTITEYSSNTISYYQNHDINVKKIHSNNGISTVDTNKYKLSWKNDSEGGFIIENLPKLEPGEKYEVTYSVNVYPKDYKAEVYQLNNQVLATSDKNYSYGNSYIKWHSKNIKKSGSYNPDNGLILWQIKINPDGLDLTNWTLQDWIFGKIHGDVKLRRDSGDYEININNSVIKYEDRNLIQYTFSNFHDEAAKRSKYTIYFYTVATDKEKEQGEAKNTATINGESDDAIVKIQKREFNLEKTFSENMIVGESDNLLKNLWYISIDLPEGNVPEFTYEDTISNAVDEKGTDLGEDSHYGIASELDEFFKKGIYFNEQNGAYVDKNDIEIDVKYFDKDSNEVSSNDSTTKVKSFKIHVKAKNGKFYKGRWMKTGLYFTYTDLSKASANAEVKSVNKGKVLNVERKAESKYKKIPKLSKGVYKGKDESGKSIYEFDSSQLSYKIFGGKIKYRIMLKTSKDDTNKNLILKDILPEGAKFDKDSLSVKYFDFEDYQPETIWSYGKEYSISKNLSYNLDGNNLEVKISNFQFAESYPLVAIYYDLDISQDDYWNDIKNSEKEYLNKITWGNEKSQVVTKVKRDPEKVDKKGVQLDDKGNPLIGSDGKPIPGKKPTGRVKYTIVINSSGEDLNKGSDILTLKDNFSGPENLQAMLDINSVKLYRYELKADNNKGTAVNESNYTLSYDSDKKELIMKIPDEMGLVLEYEYVLDTNYAYDIKVSNEVSLNGEWSNKDETVLKEVSSSATATKKIIKIYKVDSDNFKKILPGTEFKTEYWDKSEMKWKTHKEKVEVGKDGYIKWNLSGTDKDLKEDTLYKLVETKPLIGYQITEKEIYIMWQGEHENFNTAYNNSEASKAGIEKDRIVKFSNGGGIHYITNKYTKLTVNKIWQDAQGNIINRANQKDIKISLYRSLKKPDGYEVEAEEKTLVETITLNSKNNWTKSWDNLAYQDTNGNPYYYTVEEEAIAGYTTTYTNNEGIRQGNINVINTADEVKGYELPTTGGQGTTLFRFIGLLVLAIALIIPYRKRQIKCGR